MGRGELPIPGRTSFPGTPMRTPGTPGDPFNDGMLDMSPTIAITSRTQKSGKTFTEVYSDYVKLKKGSAKKVVEYDNMDRTLQSVLAQIQEMCMSSVCIQTCMILTSFQAPILSQQRAEYYGLQTEAAGVAGQLSQVIAERDSQASLAQDTSQKHKKVIAENKLLQQQLEDLGRQAQNLLRLRSRVVTTQLSLLTKIFSRSLNLSMLTRLSRVASYSLRTLSNSRRRIRSCYPLYEIWVQSWGARNRSTELLWSTSRRRPSGKRMKPSRNSLRRWKGRRSTTRRLFKLI